MTNALPQNPVTVGFMDTSTQPQTTLVSAANPLPVSATFSPSGTQDVNLTKIAGVAVKTGHGTAADALRVELPTDGTGVVGLNAGSAIIGKVGIDQTTPGTTNLVATNADAAIAAGTAPAKALVIAGRAATTEPTSATDGQTIGVQLSATGKQIVMPYSIKENFISGNIAPTTATNTQLVAAQASGIKIYMTSFSVSNTGATTSLIEFTSGSGGTVIWRTIAPAGGGSNLPLPVPVSTAAATALYVTTGSASTTIYISMSGYIGT